jgi:hypothetical protein
VSKALAAVPEITLSAKLVNWTTACPSQSQFQAFWS